VQVLGAVGGPVGALEVVVDVVVECAAEAPRAAVVGAGRPYRQAHPPIADVGPNKGPGGKDELREESHIQQLR